MHGLLLHFRHVHYLRIKKKYLGVLEINSKVDYSMVCLMNIQIAIIVQYLYLVNIFKNAT